MFTINFKSLSEFKKMLRVKKPSNSSDLRRHFLSDLVLSSSEGIFLFKMTFTGPDEIAIFLVFDEDDGIQPLLAEVWATSKGVRIWVAVAVSDTDADRQ